jgi:hypothetical protein
MKKLIVILAVIAMVGAFTATTMAAEWNFYGSARMGTFYTSDDPGKPDPGDVAESSTDTLLWDLHGNSRIGANVKFNDQIGGRFEYGSGPNLRLLYGTYNFDGGQLLIGQTYAPNTSFYSNSVFDQDGNLLGVGQFYTSRLPMIQLSMGGFKVALIKPKVLSSILGPTVADVTSLDDFDSVSIDTEVKFPKIEAAYHYKTDQLSVNVFGGYQTVDIKGEDDLGNSFDDSMDSWVAGIGGGVDFGAMYLNAGVHLGQNLGQYGAVTATVYGSSFDEAIWGGDKMIDNDGFGYLVVLGYKASDSVTVEAGYGSEESELDVSGAHKDQIVQYYANLTYTITPGFFVVPEIGMIDRKNSADNSDEGDVTYGGLKWQINF